MDSGEIDKGVAEAAQQEELYPVKLRTPLVNYFQTGLSRVYAVEQQEVQKDGAYQKVLEFNNSPFSRLMNKLSPVQEESENKSFHRSIELSKEDIALIMNKLQSPGFTDYVGSRTHRELVDELRGNFQDAKTSAVLKKQATKLKRFITGSE